MVETDALEAWGDAYLSGNCRGCVSRSPINMSESMGVWTGIDLPEFCNDVSFLEERVEPQPFGRMEQAARHSAMMQQSLTRETIDVRYFYLFRI